tara:strand:- start:913 stop:1440 length:528 start_codon:yes stop_codon:yes gene_type:complete
MSRECRVRTRSPGHNEKWRILHREGKVSWRGETETSVNDRECLERFGLQPSAGELGEIRRLLIVEVEREDNSEEGDDDLIKLLCVQLFNAGNLQDTLLIWQAKTSSFDNSIGVEVQLLCGNGLWATKEYLKALEDPEAKDALAYIQECEATGDFEQFAPGDQSESYACYYGDVAD